ncbi:hypothetical protein AGMMS49942_11860 [Spirochaetia bacterium]|nr:hypothetical protein AGMMS49942_11860 [Spirochaetia bacterium]
MKKILIAAALGMLLSAVSVTAQDFEDWDAGTDESAGLTELEVAQQRAQDAEMALEEAQRQIRDAKTKQNNAQQQADAARVQIEKERAAKERAQDELSAERAEIEKKEADLKAEQDRIAADQEKIEQDKDTVEQERIAQAQAEKDLADAQKKWKEEMQAALDEDDPITKMPKWVTNQDTLRKVLATGGEEKETIFVGIGSAKSTRDYQAIQMAEARARQDIAFQRDALIKAEIMDYAKTYDATKGKSQDTLEAFEDSIVGLQSVETSLRSAKVVKRQRVSDGTWWVVVTLDTESPEPPPPIEDPYLYKPEMKKAAIEMEQHLQDQRVGRNTLKPTVSPAVSSEPVSE